jgi:hypothetical protein
VSRGRIADENAGKIPTMNLFLDAFTKQLQKVTCPSAILVANR